MYLICYNYVKNKNVFKIILNNNLVVIFRFIDLNYLPYGYLFQYYICIIIHLKYFNSIYLASEVIN